MDQLGLILAEAVMSQEWERAYVAGTYQAFRIGEQTRIDQCLERTDLKGEPASRNLDESSIGWKGTPRPKPLRAMAATAGYGIYGDSLTLSSQEDSRRRVDNRHVTEILATRGAGRAYVTSDLGRCHHYP